MYEAALTGRHTVGRVSGPLPKVLEDNVMALQGECLQTAIVYHFLS